MATVTKSVSPEAMASFRNPYSLTKRFTTFARNGRSLSMYCLELILE